ncbi:MAG TPA: hypothetical protein VF419_05470, partial [Nitrososphaeraceae archaeon]
MKELLVVIGLLTAVILAVSTANGQALNNGTNNTAIESQPRTFTDCYSSFYSGMIFLKLSEDRDIGSEPELKQFFTNTCNFFHDETGKWLDLWKIDELKMITNQTDMNKFNTKYYPQGTPESVINIYSGMAAMAEAATEEGDEEGDEEEDED